MAWFNPSSWAGALGLGGKLASRHLAGSAGAGLGLRGLTAFSGRSVMAQRAMLGGIGGGLYGAVSDNTSVIGGALAGAAIAGPGISAGRLGAAAGRRGLAEYRFGRQFMGEGVGQAASRGLARMGRYSQNNFGKGWRQGYNFFSGF